LKTTKKAPKSETKKGGYRNYFFAEKIDTTVNKSKK